MSLIIGPRLQAWSFVFTSRSLRPFTKSAVALSLMILQLLFASSGIPVHNTIERSAIIAPEKQRLVFQPGLPILHSEGLREQQNIPRNLPGPQISEVADPLQGVTPSVLTNKQNLGPGDANGFQVFTNRTVNPPGASKSLIDEPSVANNGKTVFYTGNFYAARSTDEGATWASANTSLLMNDFGGDQDVIFEPLRGIFLWYRQGCPYVPQNNMFVKCAAIPAPNTAINRFLLCVSTDLLAWACYDFFPTGLKPAWTNQWFDYPTLALSSSNLYITTNMFRGGTFQRSLMLQASLNTLRDRQPLFLQFVAGTNLSPTAALSTFAPVQGACPPRAACLGVMLWAAHVDEATIRLYSWNENTNIAASVNIAHPAFSPTEEGKAKCPSPDGNNPCGRFDSRILGGWISDGVAGFLWNVKQDGAGTNPCSSAAGGARVTYPCPYIDVVRIDLTKNTLIDNPIIWNPNYAWIYGWASPNSGTVRRTAGLGLVAFATGASPEFLGGAGPQYPNLEVGILDGLSIPNRPPPWEFYRVASSTSSGGCILPGCPNAWGDYVRVRPYGGSGNVWIAAGYTLQGPCSGVTPCADVMPRYVVFGRVFLTTSASPSYVTLGTTPVTASDTAILTGASPTGTITWTLYNNAACSPPASFTSTAFPVSPLNRVYTSPPFTPTPSIGAGTYYWIASYSGDANNPPVSTLCGASGEKLTINKASPTVTTLVSPSSLTPPGSATDTATLAGGFSPSGSITFQAYFNSAACTSTPVFTSTVVVSGNGAYTSGSFSPTLTGTYRWVASYTGDSNNAALVTTCGASNETLTVYPMLVKSDSCGTAAVGKPFTCTATATGGIPPYSGYTWTLSANSAGCSGSSSTGSITITCTTKGSVTVSDTVQDSAGHTASASITVSIAPQPLTVTTSCPASGTTAGKPFSCTVSATGGTTPYAGTGTFSVTQPVKGTFTESFTVTDANGASATGSATLSVAAQPLVVTVNCGTGQTAGKPFNCTVSASGGSSPLSGTGTFSRTEPVEGTYTESFSVTDANGASASGSATVTVV